MIQQEGLEIHPKMKMHQRTNEKFEKQVIPICDSPLIDTIHDVGTKTHSFS
jgi:hypothetical protein